MSLNAVMQRNDIIRFLFSRDHSIWWPVNGLEGDQHGFGEECEETTEYPRGGERSWDGAVVARRGLDDVM